MSIDVLQAKTRWQRLVARYRWSIYGDCKSPPRLGKYPSASVSDVLLATPPTHLPAASRRSNYCVMAAVAVVPQRAVRALGLKSMRWNCLPVDDLATRFGECDLDRHSTKIDARNQLTQFMNLLRLQLQLFSALLRGPVQRVPCRSQQLSMSFGI